MDIIFHEKFEVQK